MRPSRALNIAACLAPLAFGLMASSAALAQWPAAQQQQAPANSAWPAPAQQEQPQDQQQQPASAWPAPADGQQQQQAAPSGAWPAPGAQAAPQQSQPPMMMPGAAGGFGGMAAQQQQEPPCFKEFMALRGEADKKGKAIQTTAQAKKMTPQIACRLFGDYASAEQKMIKYVSANADKCGMPKDLLVNLNASAVKTAEFRTKACEAAAAGPPRPAGPSLSDVLSAPVPSSSNTKTGRGTFDTLSGSALTR